MKKALLVGINYRGTDCELRGCVNDVNNMCKLLQKKGYHCKLLTDDSLDKPTKQNILLCWDWLLDGTSKNLFFHYSGHGSWILDKNGDEKDKRDETICPLDFEINGMITDDEIKTKLVQRVPIGCQLISVVDACHSETSFDLRYVYKPRYNTYILDINQYEKSNGNIVVISGCTDVQTSADIYVDDSFQGALTHSLLKVITPSSTFKSLIISINKYIKNNKLSDQIACLSFGKESLLNNPVF